MKPLSLFLAPLTVGALVCFSALPLSADPSLRLGSGSSRVEFAADGAVKEIGIAGGGTLVLPAAVLVVFRLGNRDLVWRPAGRPERTRHGLRFRYVAPTEPKVEAAITWVLARAGGGLTVVFLGDVQPGHDRVDLPGGGRISGRG